MPTKSKRSRTPARTTTSTPRKSIPRTTSLASRRRARPSPPPRNDNPWFELRGSVIQGLGAFARVDIPRGTRLIEYVGERITYAESDRRYPDSHDERHHTFLFTLNNRVILDAAFEGNDARFINHSCDPNCDAFIERGHIWIESIKRIPAGTELVYDYKYEHLDDYTEKDFAFYKCRCGAPNCRGTIVDRKKPRRKRGS